MAYPIRDVRVDPDELDDSLQLRKRSVEKGRARVREHARAREARSQCRDDNVYLMRRYTAGVPVGQLADTLDEWAGDFVASVRVRQDAADGAPEFLAEIDDRRLLLATIDLAFVSTSLGRADIATTVLTHPAVAAVPCRVLDALAVIHNLPRPLSEADVLVGVYDPWLEVGNFIAERRQDAFERYVRGWRGHGEDVRSLPPVNEFFTGAWAFEAVILAQVFGLDDGPVRDVSEYPVDLADYAREANLPRLSDDVRLPGPWTKPAQPKVIEPNQVREAVAVAGEPTRADLASLLTPVGGDRLGAATVDAPLNAAVDAGTVVVVDWRGVDPADTGAVLQDACRLLGIPVPGRVPVSVPKASAKALQRFDTWLQHVGARLVEIDVGSDDLLVVPVLAADHDAFAGRVLDGLGLRSFSEFDS